MENQCFTMKIIVNNRFGVLTRVSGLFSKRGYNIESLHVDPLEETSLSKILLTSNGDENMKEQMIKQLQKLHDVKLVQLVDSDNG